VLRERSFHKRRLGGQKIIQNAHTKGGKPNTQTTNVFVSKNPTAYRTVKQTRGGERLILSPPQKENTDTL